LVLQLFTGAALDVVHVGVDFGQGAVFLDERGSGFLSHAAHTGDVIGAIAHHRFVIDQLRRL